MKRLAWCLIFTVCYPIFGVTLDHFHCSVTVEDNRGRVYQSSAPLWVVRYPGLCEASPLRGNYCMTYASTKMDVSVEFGGLEAQMQFKYKHVHDRDENRAVQWACLRIQMQKTGTQPVASQCEKHGLQPFDPEDKAWTHVAIEESTPLFDATPIQEIKMTVPEVGKFLAGCEYIETVSRD